MVARVLPAAVRALRAVRAGSGGDRAARVLTLAVRGLPAERAVWGQAMLAELDEAQGARARWRFTIGCIQAATAMRIRATVVAGDRGGERIRALVLGTVAAALALAAYGLVRYPGLRAGGSAWAAGAVLLVLLLGYALCALTLSRGTTPQSATVRRHGLLGGLAVGAAWLLVLAPTSPKDLVFIPLAVALLAPAGVAVWTGRASRDVGSARGAALWSGLVGGLFVFVIWVTATYLRDGGPYDPQLVRDFQRSGAHDLATYAVGDNLGAALGLLVIIPTVALALGSLGGRVAANRRR